MAEIEQVFAVSVADGRGQEIADECRSGMCARAEKASQEGEKRQFRELLGCLRSLAWLGEPRLEGWLVGEGNCSVEDTGIEATCAIVAFLQFGTGSWW